MKYLVLIGDGMSDLPLPQLGNRTPLERARTPNMDLIAQNGLCGWVSNAPKPLKPGSDVAAMSIFGYDPKKHYTGRGPLEAASLGVKMGKGDIAFRCNLVTVKEGKMASFTSDHITTAEAGKILKTLNRKVGGRGIKFVTGLSYRHLMIVTSKAGALAGDVERAKCVPPHDITGKNIESSLPSGPGEKLLKLLMKESIMPLLEHPVNIERIKRGKNPATMIWLWGQGKSPSLKPFKKKFGRKAAVITAVHLLKGLGRILGMEVINVRGATGFLDTNYKGKIGAALKALRRKDVVFVHVEAPDECGHMGDVKGKIRAIEDFDKYIVGGALKGIAGSGRQGIRILVLPDHPTPIKLMTHTSDPVPFVIYDSGKRLGSKRIKGYSEREIKKSKLHVRRGSDLLGRFLFVKHRA